MSQSPAWLPIFRKIWKPEDTGRLLSNVKELAVRAERRLLYFHLSVIAINSAAFFYLPDHLILRPVRAYGILILSWIYGIGLVFIQPYFYERHNKYFEWLVPFADGVVLTAAVAVTGGFNSPLFISYYLGIVAVAFRFSTYLLYGVSVFFFVLYTGICVYLGDYMVWELVFRCAIMVLAAAAGELIVAESIAQAVSREKYQEGLLEAKRMQDIFQSVQSDLEIAVINRTRELAYANVCLESEIAKRQIIEEALTKSSEETERANQAKSEFLANVSHEIRTPLNAVMGYSDLLADNHSDDHDRKIYANAVRKNGTLLGAIIGDILDLSKIENGQIQLDMTSHNIRSVVNEVEDLCRREAELKGLEFNVSVDDPVPDCMVADQTRLKQILVNLIGNAVKFTEFGSINVRVELAHHNDLGSVVRFIVEDSGIGIATEKRQHIFTPFTQADSSTSKKYGGTGLGLSISRKLANKMNGLLELEGNDSKMGASFVLTLAAPAPIISFRPENIVDLPVKIPKRPLNGLRFLLVDDAPDNQILLQHLLNSLGAQEVDLAADGVGAIKMGSSRDYNVILMDLQMPRVDGFQATDALRRLGITTPIIAVTAHAMTDVRDRAMNGGFSGFIAKPVLPTMLVAAILDALNKSGYQPFEIRPDVEFHIQN